MFGDDAFRREAASVAPSGQEVVRRDGGIDGPRPTFAEAPRTLVPQVLEARTVSFQPEDLRDPSERERPDFTD